MRVIFNEELKAVADDLDRMAQDVRKAINGAGDALLNQNLEAAQAVIDGDIEIDALESSVIDQCVKLLAKQNPVATDLRVVVSTLRLAATFERMGDLARHIAEAARRTYPASPLPADAQPLFAEMQAFLDNVADQVVSMLTDRDTKTAEEIMVDINGMQKYTARITKNVERPDTLCLPDDVFIDISTRQIPNTGYTVAKFIMENAPYLKRIVPASELAADSDINPYDVNCAFMFKKDSDKFTFEQPLMFYQYPVQPKNLEITVPCEARTGGIMIYFPLSMLIAKGV